MTDHLSPDLERRPTVLLLGGFLTSPPLYRRMAGRLLERGAAAVVVAPVWTPDWLLTGFVGLRRVVTRSARALIRAGELTASVPESRGSPVLVVGHSAGGLVARILTSPEPFHGLRLGGHRRIGAIATLGTPHEVGRAAFVGGRVAHFAAAFAERHVPGATFAPEVGYVAVGSRAVVGGIRRLGRGMFADPFYRGLYPGGAGTAIQGDGLVPLACTDLPGARRVVLEDIVHGQMSMRPWYGSPEAIDVWWPVALEVWRGALAARGWSGGSSSAGRYAQGEPNAGTGPTEASAQAFGSPRGDRTT